MEENKEPQRFKAILLDFIGFFADMLNDYNQKNEGKKLFEEEIIRILTTSVKEMDDRSIIKNFIEMSYPHWEKARNREEDFLLNHTKSIFPSVPPKYIDQFKELYLSQSMMPDEKEGLWEYLFAFIKMSIKYLHLHPTYCQHLKIDYEEVHKIGIKWGINEKWFQENKIKKKSLSSNLL